MPPLYIVDNVSRDLVAAGCSCALLGVVSESSVTVFGKAHCSLSTSELQEVIDALPASFGFVGAFGPTQVEALQAATEVRKSGLCDGTCVAVYIAEGQLHQVEVEADGSMGTTANAPGTTSVIEWLQVRRPLRCELAVRLEVVEDSTTPFHVALQVAIQKIVRQLESPDVSYLVDGGPSGSALIHPTGTALVETLLGGTVTPHPTTTTTSGGAASLNCFNISGVVPCSPLLHTSGLAEPPQGPAFAYLPLAATAANTAAAAVASDGSCKGELPPCTATCRTTTLRLDVLCYVSRDCRLSGACRVLSTALVRQVRAAGRLLERRGQVLPVRALHFLPPGLAHPLALLYPALASDPELNDQQVLPLRRRLHAVFGLPADRPLLRAANAVELSGGKGPGTEGGEGEGGSGGSGVARLRDVHLGLVAPNIGGTTTLLQGSYEYCHYMQDRFNDSGWGCAYRSLQTICSWFRLQMYTSKPIPSHKTIQQILARLGDKPPSFVGSSNWIGAIELSYILDDYLGIPCRILTVNRGSDIPSYARELAAHFATTGTPVMIGGGVLAYTLLGVRFNEQTGEAAFLILDPHYTGGEDLKKIQQGTWVGWKRPGDSAAAGGPLFMDDAFYNFLLPQRLSTV